MEASPVLDYAPPPPANARGRALLRWATGAVIVAMTAALGALVGFALTPSIRYANEYYQINPAGVRPVGMREVASSLDSHILSLQSPEAFDAVLADVRSRGISVPSDEAGRELLEKNLKVSRIPNSTVIWVSFASRDAALADAVASAAVRQGMRQTGASVPATSLGAASGAQRSSWGAIAGGLTAACAALTVMRRLRPNVATT